MIILNVLFHSLHILMIIVNLFGWIWHGTRTFHLVIFGSTVISWIGLGFFYGWGYCFITDWHWYIKDRLGETNLPRSYITYFINNMMKLNINEMSIEQFTIYIFIILLIISSIVHCRNFK